MVTMNQTTDIDILVTIAGLIKENWTDEAQEIIAKHHFRPRNEVVLKKYAGEFRPLKLFSVDSVFGSLAQAQKVHFGDNEIFDQIVIANFRERK